MPYANNKGADQHAHPCSLISAFVVRCLDSMIPLVSISEISRLHLVSVAAQAGLCLTWLETPKTGFLMTRLSCFVFSPWYANLYEPRHVKTNKVSVCPAKTQISLGIRPVWSDSSLCAIWVAKDPSFLHADSEDSDQTGQMPRLIWVFVGCTLTLLFFFMSRLIYLCSRNIWATQWKNLFIP